MVFDHKSAKILCEDMGLLVWFMFFCLQLIAATTTSENLQGYGLVDTSGSMKLNLYHVRELGSDFSSDSVPDLADMLVHDEERAKALSDRITRKSGSKSTTTQRGSAEFERPNADRVPLSPGSSIGTGNYYVKLGLGSPAKYYSMVIDTGSSLSWLQCQPCAGYCHSQVDPVFNPSASKTYKYLSCNGSECSSLKAATLNDPLCGSAAKCVYTASYGDQSFSRGYLSRDQLTVAPSQTLPSFVFGCGQENLGLFGKSAGLIGLARDKLSMTAQLSTKYGYAFGYCLPTATSSSASSAGGFFSVGSISPSLYRFTPMLTDPQTPSLYFLRLVTISVAGKPIAVAGTEYKAPTIIDSGTVITRLPSSIYSELSKEFKTIMSKRYKQTEAYSILDTCFAGSTKSLASGTPEIKMVFQGGAALAIGAANTLIEADEGVTCLAFASSKDSSVAIIGNHQQQTFNVAYDVAGSRIGFAPGGCR